MSLTKIGSIPAAPALSAAVVADAIDCTPLDPRFSYSYAVTTKPGGSSASFTDAVVTPDLAGSYVFTVTAGADVLQVPVSVFATSVYSAILAGDLTSGTRTDATVRRILNALASYLTAAEFAAWNTGTYPARLGNLRGFGG